MDYAATFCDYAERKLSVRSSAARRLDMFPPAVSLGTIVKISAAAQLAALCAIFTVADALLSEGGAWPGSLLKVLPLVALLGVYWYADGMFSARRLVEAERFRLPSAVLFNSFGGTILAMFLLACVAHRPSAAAVCDGIVAGAAVLFVAVGGGNLARKFMRHAMRRQRLSCDIILAGHPAAMRGFIRQMHERHAGVSICAAFSLTAETVPGEIEGVPMHGGISDLLSYHARFPRPRVVVVATPEELAQSGHLVPLRMQPLHVLAMTEPLGAADFAASICQAGVPGVRLTPLLAPPLRPLDHLLKGAFDRTAGIVALFLFTPVMLGCALIIKLTSPGPVLYRQKRIGYRNNMFNVYKFRSMHITDCNRLTLTQRGDQRIFAFGRIMRKLSLDELPQLFNVIRGDMSLVGPRPHMREAKAGERLYYDVVDDYASRHRVKPGITGWAQVNGWRGPTENDQAIQARVEHDLYYIENWSFWLDIKILFRTVAGGFSGSNAF